MARLLGLDLGTSSIKAVLFDTDTGQTPAVAVKEYPVNKPLPNYAEQQPDTWWQAAVHVVRQITAAGGSNKPAAISFSGQMHGTVLLDDTHTPIHPAIIWADQRSTAACTALVQPFGKKEYAALTGTLPAVGFYGATLHWLAQNEPGLLERAHCAILPKDYLRLKMTGQAATDISDAAGTGIFDIRGKGWATPILDRVQLPGNILPPVLPSTEVAGQLTPQAAAELGLPAGIPVVAGCADQPAQAIGNGLIAPGKASVTTGSGGQIFTPVQVDTAGNDLQTDPRLHVFNHAVPEMWYVLGAVLSAGLSLRWLRNLTGLANAPNAYATLSREAAAVPPGANGLIFLPYLSGERTPHMDPLARGGFVGLTHFHQRGHLARAIMEGVAMALRQALEISLALSGNVELVIAAGGGAESNVWRQIQANMFGLPLRQSLLPQQAGIGAALLAGVGAGIYPNLKSACAQVVRHGPTTKPDPAAQTRYNELYGRFTQLYPRLRDDFRWLSKQ